VKEQLKPCPSCGAKNTDKVTLISELYDADKYKYGKCFKCGIRMYDWNKRPIEDALQAELDKLKSKLAFIENQPLLVVKPPDAVIYENALDANREYRITIDQLRKDNQALVEQMNALAGKLEKAIEILADDGAIACPAIKVGYKCNNGNGCNRLDSCLTGECWTEYFEKGDKP
jgi:hypothetical protein